MGLSGAGECLYEFGPFRLDLREHRLFRDGQLVPLRAKVFETLCQLVAAQGSLVDKGVLMREVWPDAVVEEGNLSHNISVLRRALGDGAAGQKYIETVPGRGYRFVAEVRKIWRCETSPMFQSRPASVTSPVTHLIQRKNQLQHLDLCLERALRGTRQMVMVTGEAGIGKSALVNAFAAQAGERAPLRRGYGQCLEHRGQGEAYLPVLEALSRMCRETAGQELTAFLLRCAPTWLAQMPWLVTEGELEGLQQRVLGVTRERMLREMVESVEMLTAGKPLLLVLEDLHWADYSTLDLIACLARRREPARLLVIGTYRPGDVKLRGHPLDAVVQELRVRGLCEELPLDFLDEEGVEQYLSARLQGVPPPPGLARVLHRRTEGNPLFLINVVDHWLPRGLLEKSPEELSLDVPDTLRGLLERQLAMISPEEQAILEAASVAGREFPAALAAGVLELAEEEVGSGCDRLARQRLFLNACGKATWPDGTVTARYAFAHDLYREVLYDRIPTGRKARLHARMGERLEAGYGIQARELAAELAVHFVRGHDAPRALRYLRYAAEQALARGAHREAAEDLQSALGILQGLPESPERAQEELAVLAILAPALTAIRGWGASEAQSAYLRAKELSEQLEEPLHRSAVLVGLATVLEVRGDYQRSQDLLEEHLRRVADERTDELLVESHDLLACSLFHQGVFDRSLEHARHAVELYEPGRLYALLASSGVNPAVSADDWAALNLWFLGYPDRALEKSRAALRRAEDHSYSLALAQTQAAVVHQLRGEWDSVRELAEAAIAVAFKNGFPYWAALGRILRGWALAMQGQRDEGIAELLRGLAGCRAASVEMDRPYYLALLAEAYLSNGQAEEALLTLAEALAVVRRTRRFFFEAELHRLWGRALRKAGTQCPSDVEASFQQALEAARRQKARILELRAAMSLAGLWRERGRCGEARGLLEGVCNGFTEGFKTADMIGAQAMLRELVEASAEQAPDLRAGR